MDQSEDKNILSRTNEQASENSNSSKNIPYQTDSAEETEQNQTRLLVISSEVLNCLRPSLQMVRPYIPEARNIQRVHLLINSEFHPELKEETTSVALSRPIPNLCQLQGHFDIIEGAGFDGWLMGFDTPTTITSMDSNQSSSYCEYTDDDSPDRYSSDITDNFSELSSIRYSSRTTEMLENQVSSINTPGSQGTSLNISDMEVTEKEYESATIATLSNKPTVIFHTSREFDENKMNIDHGTKVIHVMSNKSTNDTKSGEKTYNKHEYDKTADNLPAKSYTECLSEMLQKTTNFEGMEGTMEEPGASEYINLLPRDQMSKDSSYLDKSAESSKCRSDSEVSSSLVPKTFRRWFRFPSLRYIYGRRRTPVFKTQLCVSPIINKKCILMQILHDADAQTQELPCEETGTDIQLRELKSTAISVIESLDTFGFHSRGLEYFSSAPVFPFLYTSTLTSLPVTSLTFRPETKSFSCLECPSKISKGESDNFLWNAKHGVENTQEPKSCQCEGLNNTNLISMNAVCVEQATNIIQMNSACVEQATVLIDINTTCIEQLTNIKPACIEQPTNIKTACIEQEPNLKSITNTTCVKQTTNIKPIYPACYEQETNLTSMNPACIEQDTNLTSMNPACVKPATNIIPIKPACEEEETNLISTSMNQACLENEIHLTSMNHACVKQETNSISESHVYSEQAIKPIGVKLSNDYSERADNTSVKEETASKQPVAVEMSFVASSGTTQGNNASAEKILQEPSTRKKYSDYDHAHCEQDEGLVPSNGIVNATDPVPIPIIPSSVKMKTSSIHFVNVNESDKPEVRSLNLASTDVEDVCPIDMEIPNEFREVPSPRLASTEGEDDGRIDIEITNKCSELQSSNPANTEQPDLEVFPTDAEITEKFSEVRSVHVRNTQEEEDRYSVGAENTDKGSETVPVDWGNVVGEEALIPSDNVENANNCTGLEVSERNDKCSEIVVVNSGNFDKAIVLIQSLNLKTSHKGSGNTEIKVRNSESIKKAKVPEQSPNNKTSNKDSEILLATASYEQVTSLTEYNMDPQDIDRRSENILPINPLNVDKHESEVRFVDDKTSGTFSDIIPVITQKAEKTTSVMETPYREASNTATGSGVISFSFAATNTTALIDADLCKRTSTKRIKIANHIGTQIGVTLRPRFASKSTGRQNDNITYYKPRYSSDTNHLVAVTTNSVHCCSMDTIKENFESVKSTGVKTSCRELFRERNEGACQTINNKLCYLTGVASVQTVEHCIAPTAGKRASTAISALMQAAKAEVHEVQVTPVKKKTMLTITEPKITSISSFIMSERGITSRGVTDSLQTDELPVTFLWNAHNWWTTGKKNSRGSPGWTTRWTTGNKDTMADRKSVFTNTSVYNARQSYIEHSDNGTANTKTAACTICTSVTNLGVRSTNNALCCTKSTSVLGLDTILEAEILLSTLIKKALHDVDTQAPRLLELRESTSLSFIRTSENYPAFSTKSTYTCVGQDSKSIWVPSSLMAPKLYVEACVQSESSPSRQFEWHIKEEMPSTTHKNHNYNTVSCMTSHFGQTHSSQTNDMNRNSFLKSGLSLNREAPCRNFTNVSCMTSYCGQTHSAQTNLIGQKPSVKYTPQQSTVSCITSQFAQTQSAKTTLVKEKSSEMCGKTICACVAPSSQDCKTNTDNVFNLVHPSRILQVQKSVEESSNPFTNSSTSKSQIKSNINNQLLSLSRLIGSGRRASSFVDNYTPTSVLSSNLDADKWMRACTSMQKDAFAYQSVLEPEKDFGSSPPPAKSSTSEILSLLGEKTSFVPSDRVKSLELHDSLADVLPIQKPQEQLEQNQRSGSIHQPSRMVDAVTSDQVLKREKHEFQLQVVPAVSETGIGTIPDTLLQHRSACVLTSKCILPTCAPCTHDLNSGKAPKTPCKFVYGEPKCAIHKHSSNVEVQATGLSQNSLKVGRLVERADKGVLTPFFGMLPVSEHFTKEKCNIIGTVLCPQVYKALNETSNTIVNEDNIETPERDTSVSTVGTVVLDTTTPPISDTVSHHTFDAEPKSVVNSADVATVNMAKTSSNLVRAQASLDLIKIYKRDSHKKYIESECNSHENYIKSVILTDVDIKPHKSDIRSTNTQVNNSVQYNYQNTVCKENHVLENNRSKDRNEEKDRLECAEKYSQENEQQQDIYSIKEEKSEEDIKTNLVTSCRYYSTLLSKQLGKVKENLTKHLTVSPEDDDEFKSIVNRDPSNSISTMKPSGREDLACQTGRRKIQQLRGNRLCILSHTTRVTDICKNDKEHLQSVYSLLSSIEGRMRRLKSLDSPKFWAHEDRWL